MLDLDDLSAEEVVTTKVQSVLPSPKEGDGAKVRPAGEGARSSRTPPPPPPGWNRGSAPPPLPSRPSAPAVVVRSQAAVAEPSAPSGQPSPPDPSSPTNGAAARKGSAAAKAPAKKKKRAAPRKARAKTKAMHSQPVVPVGDDPKKSPQGIEDAPTAKKRIAETVPMEAQVAPSEAVHPEADEIRNASLRDANELLHMCQRELAQKPGERRAARLHYEIASLYEHPLRDLKRAADHYQRATELLPDHGPSLRGARRVLIARGKYRTALRTFDLEIPITPNPKDRAVLLLHKGRLLEATLGQPDDARVVYLQAQELDPTNLSVLKAVERCERRAEDWPRLSDAFERQANAIKQDAKHRAALVAMRANIVETKVDEEAEAAQLYEAALSMDGQAPGALWSLKRLSHSSRQWQRLVTALMREANQSGDPNDRAHAQFHIAALAQHKLGDRDAAVAALKIATEHAPSDLTLLRALVQALADDGQEAAVAEALAALFSRSNDAKEKVAAAFRIGQSFAQQSEQASEAEPWFARALAIDPAHQPAVNALDDIYTHGGRWDELVAMRRAEAEASSDTRVRAASLARIAEILEERLGRKDEARAVHAEVLGLTPDHEPSFRALTRLCTEAGRFREVVELYQRVVDRNPDSDQAIAYLFRIGSVCEDHLRDLDAAIHAFRQILTIDSTNVGALQALQRVGTLAMKFNIVVTALEREAAGTSPDAAVPLLYRAALVYDAHLSQTDTAIERLRSVLDRAPGHIPALTTLGRVFSREGRWDDLLTTLTAQREHTQEGPDWVLLSYRMGEVCEEHLARSEAAVNHYREALRVDPNHEPAFERLRKLLAAHKDWQRLADAYEARLDSLDSARARSHLAFDLGRLYEDRLAHPERALETYEKALGDDPSFHLARDAMGRLLTDRAAWQKLVDASMDEVGVSADPVRVAESLLRAGRVHAYRMDDPRSAIATFEALLERDPHHLGALLELEALYDSVGDHEALMSTLRRQVAVVSDPVAKASALRELANLLAIHRPDDAPAVFKELLEHEPADEEALRALAMHADAIEDRESGIGLQSRLAASAQENLIAAAHQQRVAEMLEHTDNVAALGAFRAVLALDPHSLRATRGFTRVAQHMGDPDVLREAALREAEVTRDESLAVSLLLRAAKTRNNQDDVKNAAADLAAALELDPDHEEAALELERALVALDEVAQLIDRLGRAADTAQTKVRKAELHLQVGRLHRQAGDIPAALAATDRALVQSPSFLPALTQEAELLEAAGRWEEAAGALLKVVRRCREPATSVPAHLRLARLASEKLHDSERAKKSLRAVLDEEPNNRAALSHLASLEAGGGAPGAAVGLARRLVETATTEEERVQALLELANIEAAREHPAGEADALQAAIRISGSGSPAAQAYQQRIESGSTHATWSHYAVALEAYIDKTTRAGLTQPRAIIELAEVYGRHLGRVDQALSKLRSGIETFPTAIELRLAICGWLTSLNQHDRVVEELRQVLKVNPRVPDAWRALAGAYTKLGQGGEAAIALEPLVAIEAATANELEHIKKRQARPAHAPPGLLGDAGFRQLQASGAYDHPVAGLVSALSDALAKLYPMTPAAYGVTKRDRITSRSGHPLRLASDRVAMILGVPEYDLYFHEESARDVAIELGNPCALFVPAWAETLSQAELVYLLGRRFAGLARNLAAVDRIPGAELAAIVSSVTQSYAPHYSPPPAGGVQVDIPSDSDIMRAIPRRSRRLVEEAAGHYANAPAIDVARWADAIRQSSARAAMLVADDVVACVSVERRIHQNGNDDHESRISALLRFWVSDTAVRFRRAVNQASVPSPLESL